MERDSKYGIMPEILKRWSPRAFDTKPIPKEDIMALIEAASFAPSCFNEQPWRFLVADEGERLSKMRSVLTPSNQEWGNAAPVLILIVSKKTFTHNEKNNSWHQFDAGTAWGYLSLEAQKRGLITHAMGGFDKEKARSEFAIPEEYTVIAVVAVGRYGNADMLTPELREREKPGERKPIKEQLL